jgi:2,5-diamino-6-(ribosylamino)-4(3H)-pyrimidinone 5'-phosphate reductase
MDRPRVTLHNTISLDGRLTGSRSTSASTTSSRRAFPLAWLREQPFWRDVVVLCSGRTPQEHLRRLQADHIVTGDDRVDLVAALREVAARYAVTAVRVDAGGGLNGHLLDRGLVDELSIVVAPHLAGPDALPLASAGPAALRLAKVRQLRDGQVHLRYAVIGPSAAGHAG